MSEPTRPIRPELLAAKIEKIENFEQPRLLEEFGAEPRLVRALWLLEWVSQPRNYAGGLSKFSSDLIDASRDRIGTARMLKAGAAAKYSRENTIAIFRELPCAQWEALFDDPDRRVLKNAVLGQVCAGEDWWERKHNIDPESRKSVESLLVERMTPCALRSVLSDVARSDLADYFKALCELPDTGFGPGEGGAPWYFANVADALLAFMDRRAEQLRSRIAETEITKEVRRWTEKSRSMCRPVMFVGNSRFGKTEAIKLETTADPGSCRLVNTPSSNGTGDLLREVAKSLGIEVGPRNAGRDLRERIDYVLRFSHLQLIFDESQFLLPGTYTRTSAPARLNWVRRSIMDQNVAAVFVCTPQSYLPAKSRFVRTTGFAMEQFDERVLTRELPSELSEADLLAVARIHFADLAEEYLRFVVDTVLATERNFVSDIEKIATLAKDNAREAGRGKPALADIEAAIADVLPTVKPPAAVQKMPMRSAGQRPCKPVAEALPMPRRGLEIVGPDRLIRPVEVPA